MRCNYTILVFIWLLSVALPVNAGNTNSIATGNYTTNIWSTVSCGGATCLCSPGGGADIVICSGTTVTYTGAFVVGPGGNVSSLTINNGGTFITTGDMTFKNGSTVNIVSGGVLTVQGNFANNNNSNSISVNGSMSVAGSATFGDGSTVSGTGTIAISGSTSGAGTVFGGPPGCSGCTLAIQLESFTAVYNNDVVSLAWASATETNNSFYTVEHTIDGINYTLLTNVKGAGNSSTPHNYSGIDPSPENGVNYYRLSQTDFDGTTTYLGIIPVTVNINVNGVKVFPNPAKNKCIVSYNDTKNESFQFTVYDYTGREISSAQTDAAIGINSFEVDVSKLPAGMYFVSFPVNGQMVRTRFIKQ